MAMSPYQPVPLCRSFSLQRSCREASISLEAVPRRSLHTDPVRPAPSSPRKTPSSFTALLRLQFSPATRPGETFWLTRPAKQSSAWEKVETYSPSPEKGAAWVLMTPGSSIHQFWTLHSFHRDKHYVILNFRIGLILIFR